MMMDNTYSMDNLETFDTLSLLTGRSDTVVGIVGFGHLGHSLAVPLVKNGLPKERLLISHRGSEETHERAKSLGLDGCLTDTRTLMAKADIIVVATRPQDVLSLSGIAIKSGALVISCMAGLPLDLLRTIFRTDVCRMMCSGPDTILEGRGVATMYPSDCRMERVLRLMGLRLMETSSERELDSFTVGICIPAILLNIRVPKKEVRTAMGGMEMVYPVYGALKGWIRGVMPAGDGDAEEKSEYLENVSTKGGISEAMTVSLRNGSSFGEALQRGMDRGREITDEVRRSIVERLKLAG